MFAQWKTVPILLAVILSLAPASADEPAVGPPSGIPIKAPEPQPLSLAGPAIQSRDIASRLGATLKEPISLDVEEQALDDLIDQLQETIGIPVRIDRQSVHKAGILPDEPISGEFVDLPAGDILSRVL